MPSGNCYRTIDGQWVMLLGVDTARWLIPTLKTFVGLGAVLKVARLKIFGAKTDPVTGKKLTVIESAQPIFEYCNTVLAEAVSKLSWVEMEKTLKKQGLWYCKVQTPAGEAAYKQAWDTGALFTDGKPGAAHFVGAPVQFGCGSRLSTTAPQLQE